MKIQFEYMDQGEAPQTKVGKSSFGDATEMYLKFANHNRLCPTEISPDPYQTHQQSNFGRLKLMRINVFGG